MPRWDINFFHMLNEGYDEWNELRVIRERLPDQLGGREIQLGEQNIGDLEGALRVYGLEQREACGADDATCNARDVCSTAVKLGAMSSRLS